MGPGSEAGTTIVVELRRANIRRHPVLISGLRNEKRMRPQWQRALYSMISPRRQEDYAAAGTGAVCAFVALGNGLKVIAIRNAPSPIAQEPT
ncbi:MAG: hypothetical protein JWR80_9308 [Bradyrhizobium sp.]|nr:hypothetical protein [Bradyrhizobium sp.]